MAHISRFPPASRPPSPALPLLSSLKCWGQVWRRCFSCVCVCVWQTDPQRCTDLNENIPHLMAEKTCFSRQLIKCDRGRVCCSLGEETLQQSKREWQAINMKKRCTLGKKGRETQEGGRQKSRGGSYTYTIYIRGKDCLSSNSNYWKATVHQACFMCYT